MNIREQYQTWYTLTRVLVFTDDASVQLELFKEPQGEFHISAYIFALWVDPSARNRGIATALLDRVEQIAKERGCKSIFLEWDKRDTSTDILEWYERRGYNERAFNSHKSLLEKRLDDVMVYITKENKERISHLYNSEKETLMKNIKNFASDMEEAGVSQKRIGKMLNKKVVEFLNLYGV